MSTGRRPHRPTATSPARRAAALAGALAVGSLTAGCASEPSEPDDPVAEQRAAGPVDAACPVTLPMPPDRYPQALREQEGRTTWFGQDDLWVDLGGFGSTARLDDAVLARHTWWTVDSAGRATLEGGPPTVRATRLDAPGRVVATVSGHADDRSAWWPTRLTFPRPGCWLVTGERDGTVVRVVVKAG